VSTGRVDPRDGSGRVGPVKMLRVGPVGSKH